MFLRKFCQQEPKFKRKFQAILETLFCDCVSLRPPSNGEGLTLICVGFLAVHFEVGGGGGGGGGGKNNPPFLKLVRIMLETSNLAHKYTHTFRFRKYTFQYQGPVLAEIISLLKAIV